MLNKDSVNVLSSPSRGLFDIKEAAKFLGVHTATIRRWAYAKRLPGSKVGVRGDWRFTLDNLVKMNTTTFDKVGSNQFDAQRPLTDWKDIPEASHFVQFYEEEAFLLTSIQDFIETADAVVVIASNEHIRAIKNKMLQEKIQKKPGSECFFLDAQTTLAKISIDSVPDAKLFDQVIGELIRDIVGNHKQVRAFGEMVAMLWADGNKAGAIKLEELWNDLQTRYRFTLCCAYPIKDVGGATASDAFNEVCSRHSCVLPAESYSNLDTVSDRFREVAALQQKAFSLEAEIKERQRAELKLLRAVEALKASEEFNRRIIENSADSIMILNPDGTLLQMNQPGVRLFEIDSAEQLIGRDYLELWKSGQYEAANGAIKTAKSGGIGRFQGMCPTGKGTHKWWDVVITPMYDNEGRIERLLAISRDITNLKELDQRKEDFLSSTSHELKTPLTSQKAFVQLLERQLKKNNDKNYTRYVTKIAEQTDKLTKLVSDLLDASKIQGGKLILHRSQLAIQSLVEEAVEEIRTISSHTILIHGKILNQIKGDKEKISQVLINLLTNAVKYSPKSKNIEVFLREDKTHVYISVRDFGIGIGQKDQRQIFDRFYRVNDNDEKTYPGMGMGLFITAEIVKQHGGSINVESARGVGSTFNLTLPR